MARKSDAFWADFGIDLEVILMAKNAHVSLVNDLSMLRVFAMGFAPLSETSKPSFWTFILHLGS